MRDAPDVDALLAAARESLLRTILPATPAEQRLEVLITANALAIARRRIAAGDVPLQDELAALAAIYKVPVPEVCGPELLAALTALNARLARDIRRGAFDPPSEAAAQVRALLWQVTEQKVRENKPKLLEAR